MRRDNRGFTLIELLIAVTILGLVMVSIGQLLDSGVRDWQRGETKLEAEQNLRIALERMNQDLRGAQGVIAVESSDTKLVVQLSGRVKIEYYLDNIDVSGPGGLKGKTLLRVYSKYSDDNLTSLETGYPKQTELASYLDSLNFSYYDSKNDATFLEINIASGVLPSGQKMELGTGITLRGKFLDRESTI